MTNGSLMKVESSAECSPWSILQYFWPALSNNWFWKPIFGLFTQVLQYLANLDLCCPYWVVFDAFVVVVLIYLFFYKKHFQKVLSGTLSGVKLFWSRPGSTFCQSWSGHKLLARVISRQGKLQPAKKDWMHPFLKLRTVYQQSCHVFFIHAYFSCFVKCFL